MQRDHRYAVDVVWEGNLGAGTRDYRSYSRRHVVRTAGGADDIAGSADRAFHGDADRWNPEELLLAALSQCHMLSYLHVAARRGIVVESYRDQAEGVMRQVGDGGRFTGATLHPVVAISAGEPADAVHAHEEAHRLCFIASSVDFPVRVEPVVVPA